MQVVQKWPALKTSAELPIGTAAPAPQRNISVNLWEENTPFSLPSDNQNTALERTLVPTGVCKLGGQGEVWLWNPSPS